MTVTLQSTNLSLTNRILVTVPVIIVCDPLPNTPARNTVTVYIEQNIGKKTIKGTGLAHSLMGLPFFTCDSRTPNFVTVSVVPDADSGPFHGGTATITNIVADYWTGVSHGDGGFSDIQMEGAVIGPIDIRLR